MDSYRLEDFYIDYSTSNYDEFCRKLEELTFRKFEQETITLAKLKNIPKLPELSEATMTALVPVYYDVRNKITEVLLLKHRVREETDTISKISYLADSFFEREKDRLFMIEEIRKLSSDSLRNAEVKKRLDKLMILKTKLKAILTFDVKSLEEDIKDTQNHLKEHREDLSRIQSAVALALDTGELLKTYWRPQN